MDFKEIYTIHKNRVFNLTLNYAQNIEDAEEITQDVFVSVYDSLNGFNHKSSLSTWIHRITINKCLDFLRAKKRKKRFAFITSLFFDDGMELKHNPIEYAHPGILLEDKEDINYLFEQIDKLPFNQKTALILQKVHDKPQQEVAEIMNISTKAVGQLIQRAKRNLNKILREEIK